ncbi:abortive infection system toxin AbiGii family protein [Thomasclavelia cocleata]|uniref:Uncharacterized protein n=1 Tax=Thomasclavelia cocleata TaxID=69824 RepID=A0A829Z7M9_9FIRM|nr:abortive infection system toxin AbiGii family protein [Thomasclavelia cocleata]GFI40176.1 hypothetical protein IMSAGC017_00207 [Thomasclavelia cocleata]
MANFIKNFKNQNFKDGFIPESILAELSSKWNGSLQYVYDQNGSYILTPTTEEVKVMLKNFQVENIDEIKKNCKKENITMDEIISYSYNAQKIIYLKPQKDFRQYINDIEVDTKDMVIFKEGQIDFKHGKMFIQPQKMNNRVKLLIGNGIEEHSYEFVQRPIESLTKRYFVSSEDSKISIEYVIDDSKIKFNMEINYQNIDNVSDYLKTLSFIQSLFDKGMFINKKRITSPDSKDVNYNQRKQLIELWKKIELIEKEMKIQFQLKKDVLNKDEYISVCLLYRTIIEKEPVKRNQKINNFSYSYEEISEEIIENIKQRKNNNFCLEFYEKKEIEILGQKIEMYELRCYFNLYVNEIEKLEEKNKYILILKENKKNKMFNSVMLFKTQDNLEEFINNKEHFNILYKAKQLFNEENNQNV